MNAKQKLHQVHLQEWAIRFADQKASGLTVRQWCEQNKLSFHTYNYWKHLLKEEVVGKRSIASTLKKLRTAVIGGSWLLLFSNPFWKFFRPW